MDTGSFEPYVDAFEVFGLWLGRVNLHPRIFDGPRGALFCRRKVTLPTSQGSITPIAKSSRRGEGRVTLRSRSRRDPEHQHLAFVYSGSVDRFRSACCGRPDSLRSGRVSCVHDQRGEVVAHPSLEGRRKPRGARHSTGRRKASLSRD